MNNLDALFGPRSIAIVGASGRPGSPYARPLHYLQKYGFTGPVYPVNPRHREVGGLRCVPALADIPDPVDQVLVLTPARDAVDVVREAGVAGARSAVVFSSGFAESGGGGRALQEELAKAARASGVRLLGPNSQGLAFVPTALACTFTGALEGTLPAPTGVAYVGESGAIGGAILDQARECGLGMTAWVSTGNSADVGPVEAARYLLDLAGIEVIMLYLESAVDGAGYRQLAEQAAELGKHLVVLRAGRSAASRRAVASHTGAMLSPLRAFDLVSDSAGVTVVHDTDELLATAYALSALPLPGGSRVGIVTTSGGAGSLMADACAEHGLTVDPLPEAARARLAELVPDFGAVANPVDVTAQVIAGGDQGFCDVCEIVARSDDIDIAVVLGTNLTGDLGARLAAGLVPVVTRAGKPVLVSWMAGHEPARQAREVFVRSRVPVFRGQRDVARTAQALLARGAARRRVQRPHARRPPPDLAGVFPHAGVLVEAEGIELLDEAGICHPPSVLATDAAAAASAARKIGGPVVMKVQSRSILHKTDVGGVQLDVPPGQAAEVYSELAALGGGETIGVLVQATAPPGVELLVGATASGYGFPPVLTVGLGGSEAELHQDVASACLPVEPGEARRLLLSLRAAPLLTGYRGRPAADLDAAADVLVRLGRLVERLGSRFREIEINPLVVAPAGRGGQALDVLVRLEPEMSTGPPAPASDAHDSDRPAPGEQR